MSTVHLITGLPCAGKTTYSESLKAETAGVHLSLDYWLITSFGQYSIDEVGHEKHLDRVMACRKLIWDVATELLNRDIDVILDDGFFLRETRVQYSEFAISLGVGSRTHFLDTPKHIIRSRVSERNLALLDWFFETFEKPSATEGPELVVMAEDVQKPTVR